MNIPVVTVSSREPEPHETYYRPDVYKESLRRLGVEPVVLKGEWQGLMSKPLMFRQWLRENQDQKHAFLTDCWDVIFVRHPNHVALDCTALFGEAVVFNTEKSCWPLTDLAHCFPYEGTPWRYLNGGVMFGPVDLLLAMFEAMDLESYGVDRTEDGRRIEPNDAVPLVRAFIEQYVPVKVDARCQVFQCFSECRADEFEINDSGVKNIATGTKPGVLHFNGGSKNELMRTVMNAMGL